MVNSGMHIDPVIDGRELRFRSGTPPYGVDHHGIRATINGSAHHQHQGLCPESTVCRCDGGEPPTTLAENGTILSMITPTVGVKR
jgi:hypothetical protein